ncbi:MAG TPA: hypothetical protein VK837_06280 [Longimicrobiales bacterium]|nr:hypothetical protein [Longimicrobiales bacterium]
MRVYRVLGAATVLCLLAAASATGSFVPPAVAPLFAETVPPRLPQPSDVQPVVSGTSLLVAWESASPAGSFEVQVGHPRGGTPIAPMQVHGAMHVTIDIGDVDFSAGLYCVRVRAIPQAGQDHQASPFSSCAPVSSFTCDMDWQVEALPGGGIEVVVFGSARMDLSALDPASIRLGDGRGQGTTARATGFADVKDAGGVDGYKDLVARFDMSQMRRNGDLSHDTASFYLQAMTRGGSPACGSIDLRRSR